MGEPWVEFALIYNYENIVLKKSTLELIGIKGPVRQLVSPPLPKILSSSKGWEGM